MTMDHNSTQGKTPQKGAAATPFSVDLSRLRALQALDTTGRNNVLQQVFTLFAESTVTQIAQMHDACSGRDRIGLSQSAHALRSGSANLGLSGLATLSHHLESAAGTADWRDLEAMLRNLDQLVPQAVAGLQENIERLVAADEAAPSG